MLSRDALRNSTSAPHIPYIPSVSLVSLVKCPWKVDNVRYCALRSVDLVSLRGFVVGARCREDRRCIMIVVHAGRREQGVGYRQTANG